MRNNNRNNDDGDLSAWLVVWIVLTALYFLLAVWVVIYLISYTDILNIFTAKDNTSEKIEIVAKLGTLFFAIIGFPVIIIRLSFSEAQRREALRQGERTQKQLEETIRNNTQLGERAQKQLEETERNNIAKLLIDATKMLGENTSKAERIAAIACLDNIMQGSSGFSKQAAEVVYNFIRSKGVDKTTWRLKIENSFIEKSFFALARYSNKNREKFPFFGFKVTRIHFEGNTSFPLYFHGIKYENCHFRPCVLNLTYASFQNCKFSRCIIEECFNLGIFNSFRDCIFIHGFATNFRFSSPDINNTHAKIEQFINCYYLEGLNPSVFADYDFKPMSLQKYQQEFAWNFKK